MLGSLHTLSKFKLLGFEGDWLWQQLESPCLGEHLSIGVQLGFAVILFVQFVLKCIVQISDYLRGGRKITDQASENRLIGRNLSGFYKASVACTIFLCVIHVLMFFALLYGIGSRCRVEISVFSSEIIHVVAWGVAVVAVCGIVRNKSVKYPWLLRGWWICSFFLSIIRVALYEKFGDGNQVRAYTYAQLVCFLPLIFLLALSVYGKTGIVFVVHNGLADPLLHENGSEHEEDKRDSAYERATLLQLVTFSWLNPLFALGYKRRLEHEDIPDVCRNDSAKLVSNAFTEKLDFVMKKNGGVDASIYKAIYLFCRKKAAINAGLAVLSAALSYVGPYLIDDFVNFLTEKKGRSLSSGYLLALAFLSAKVIETIAQRQWIFEARRLGIHLRGALASHIYKKGIRLSSRSRQSHTSGEIINYMSVDIERITDFAWYLNMIWMLPVQISLAIYILHTNLGLGSLGAIATTLIIMSCNIPLTKVLKDYQKKIMEAKDNRMKATSEVLRNMKILKLQAWDYQYLQKIESLRKVEHDWLWKSSKLTAFTAFLFWGSPTLISLVTFGLCTLLGIELTAGKVISALATFQMLQDPIFSLPDVLSAFIQGKVSVDRVASFLQVDEIQQDAIVYVPKDQTEFDIEIENGIFSWTPESINPSLDQINLKVKRGMKVAICGTVGSGKSSLLSCILGEIEKLSGTVKISGTKAYVPQSPWILSGNIKENILFGNEYEHTKYNRTITACALTKDLELFPCGDLTEIGERGINMSGGQKQRIQIARAVYQDADIYLLDDPFSAVDAHTGTQLFKDCLMGALKEKTIIYVTHQVEFLPAADLILVMQNGRIVQVGGFEELLKQNFGFEALVGAHNQALESILSVEHSSRISQVEKREKELNGDSITNADPLNSKIEQNNSTQPMREKRGKLIQEEERKKGSIGKEVYLSYMTRINGGIFVPIIVLAHTLFQALQIASNYWMTWACPTTSETEPKVGMNVMLLVYFLLAVGSSLGLLLRSLLLAVIGLQTAQKFFKDMLYSIFHAPMAFFDTTPTGRILNRASGDQSTLDLAMAVKLGWCAFSVIRLLGTIVVMSQVAWEVFAILVPVTAACIWYQHYYTPTAREVGRLAGIHQAPILHHYAESLAGAATIRAFNHEDRFFSTNLRLIDAFSKTWFYNNSVMEWLYFRLNALSHFVFAFSLALLVSLPEGTIDPGNAGLAISYGINLNWLQASVIWSICSAQRKIISVERILQYSKIKSEAPLVVEDCRPPSNWPQEGSITFKNLQIRYADHLPDVLKDISCVIPGKKKVGVVGRTGCGKSTLIQAIFRIVEPRGGSIVIDNVDICKIGLHDLRSRLSIIPQDPLLFEGTVRGNLDPLEQYSDQEIWEALDKCQLGGLVREKEMRLNSPVVENGENWSVGQRQLFCLGRALLKKSNILVLDEATASVDSATDSIIQSIIRQEFENQTVITIAHRIHTVIDSDLVLVLSDGRIAEFDSPGKLLERDDSFFSKLVKEYSMRSQGLNSLKEH
ncbi:putative ABC transporter C family member 15 isoform X2 [Cucurbita pepo subsp. pepo]|uniref:putative ABC transporter C family member 15 isoform X2 n=1 Tax=Cucurbita pepo subsp. pepo TaxID=3664 RepID=UPI000C9D7E78|nr:putative ABC transporter C family member 15 isoform X2 [Cucurbita pepo subsp. pepo]